jgi:hypothetical protein
MRSEGGAMRSECRQVRGDLCRGGGAGDGSEVRGECRQVRGDGGGGAGDGGEVRGECRPVRGGCRPVRGGLTDESVALALARGRAPG